MYYNVEKLVSYIVLKNIYIFLLYAQTAGVKDDPKSPPKQLQHEAFHIFWISQAVQYVLY